MVGSAKPPGENDGLDSPASSCQPECQRGKTTIESWLNSGMGFLSGPHLLCLSLAIVTFSRGFPVSNRTRLSGLVSSVLSKPTGIFSSSSSADETMAVASNPKSWRSLLEISIAKTRKIRGSNYVQLSTVEDGEPRCRTVVFRGFQKLPSDHTLFNECESYTTTMKMCTDMRSRKVAQNHAQPIAELVWWFPTTNEQYRVRGRLILVGQDYEQDSALMIARKELWGNLSDPARESFLGSLVPGQAYDGDETAEIPNGGRDENGKPVPPPANFLLMLFDPTNVDYLRLGHGQYRQADTRVEGTWSFERLNP